MIDIASRATNGVKIPGQKATRAQIMRMFKDHLTRLKAQLNVCICHIEFILEHSPSVSVRERDGLPWGFPEQPAPVPVKTRTRSHGPGF